MIVTTPEAEMLTLPFTLDSYGNVVDFDLVLQSGIGGLLNLKYWLDFSNRSSTPENFALWADSRDGIASARKGMEAAFGRLGNDFENLLVANKECLEKARQGSAACVMATSGKPGESEGVFLKAARLCDSALRFSEQTHEHAAMIRNGLADLENLSRQIHSMENLVQEQMRPAEVVQVLLRIECARLDESTRAPLEALGVEISRVCAMMTKTLSEEFALLHQIHATVLEIVAFVRKLEASKEQADRRRTELSKEMEELRRRGFIQAERDQALAEVAVGLDRTIARVIQAMQFQDIVGQRWEHVQLGFSNLAQSPPESPDTAWNSILQHAQLVEANAEMSSALGQIENSLQSVEEVETQILEQLKQSQSDKGRSQMNAHIKDILTEVWELVKSNENEMQSIDALISPLAMVAGKMGGDIGSVSHQMRLIALNAQIQVSHFGAGTGLEVLAEALRRIAEEISASGETLTRHSISIQNEAVSLRDCFGILRQQSQVISEECHRDFKPALVLFEYQEQCCMAMLGKAVNGVTQLGTAREAMRQQLDQCKTPLDQLAEIAHTCGEFVDKTYRGDARVMSMIRDGKLTDGALNGEASRYTMASENEVLLRVAGKTTPDSEISKQNSGELDLF